MVSKILLIDDDALFAKDLESQFKNASEQFIWISTGEDVMKNIKATVPALILLDLRLPTISGLKVLEMLKSDDATKFIPVIILSSYGGEDNAARAFELGVVKFIEKSSSSIPEIAKQVREYLPNN